ncbi:MAG: 1-acyl-sn-glycerol-3-phosphate acyltransferase [Muribaculaceae bacterium]|nr:1-acyl-sn-glycerol-3-phosphate acyltransferase [Muribaculaceae bacterium]MDE6754398.1 1-acyl-sn-glycerol-3-phosphate acyltransferase [Muribaculaceae bacterium]
MDKPLEINLHKILRDRLPEKTSRFLPGFMISALERIIHQDELNEMLRVTFPARGSAFARKILEHLGIEVEVKGMENLKEGQRYMFASNHPLGGLDGIALIAVLGEKYGDDGIRFMVNDMLMNVEPLRDVFLPINKFGSQGREAAKAINAALESDMQVLQFPAGLVSRLHEDGSISDLTWQKAFVSKAIETGREIVPIRFEGLNSSRFYKAARWRKKLNIKVNIEQVLLPGEVCRARGSRYRIIIGKPVSVRELKAQGLPPLALAAKLRRDVYNLK